MGLRDNLKKTKRTGIYYKEHPTRKNGVRMDRLFVLRYKAGGKEYVSSFGWESEGKTELDAERKLTELKANARDGTGPLSLREERRENKDKEKAKITVEDLIAEYVKRHAKRKKARWQEDQRALEKDLLPAWKNRKAQDITRREAAHLLEDIAKRAPVQACNVLEKARKMFNLAVKWGYVEINPFAGQERPASRPERTRILSEEEIHTFWNALDKGDLSMSPEMRRALKLILITGQRPGEVIAIHHREISGHWWTLPIERSKNRREHRVYLTKTALELIGKGKGYIFPSPTSKKGEEKPIDVNAMARCLRRNILGANDGYENKGVRKFKEIPTNRIGIEHFTPHDLRRTFYSNLARLRVTFEVRERIVNHALGKLEKTYNQYDFEPEKMIAMQRWEVDLQRILNKQPAKVISIGG